MSDLGEYRGRDIDGVSMTVVGLGGGLDDPIAVDPEVVEIGEERMLCVPVVCVEHKPKVHNRKEPDAGDLELVMIFTANGPQFFVEGGVVAEARMAHLEKVTLEERRRDEAKQAKKSKDVAGATDGQTELEVDEDSLERAHIAGEHKSLVHGCPGCTWESELEEDGR